MQSKTTPKTTKPKEDVKEQSVRFIATARELDADEAALKFETVFTKIIRPKKIKSPFLK